MREEPPVSNGIPTYSRPLWSADTVCPAAVIRKNGAGLGASRDIPHADYRGDRKDPGTATEANRHRGLRIVTTFLRDGFADG
jgi:hypothetical protein